MLKRQAAFTSSRPLLKGALHCHTTRSDGQGTPQDVIAKHVAHGYDFMALTDHRRYNTQSYGINGITIVPGMEMDSNFQAPNTQGVHCHHIVCLGPEEGNGFVHDQRFESMTIHKPEETQRMLDWIHAGSNLTIYCHPEWSGTPAGEFKMLHGNFAMEIWNSGCALEDRLDMNAAYWDELLAEGQRIYGVATDDGHNMAHHCVGWVRVNAENHVTDILEALKNGAFYSSCGPEIRDFYVEDGVAHVCCSPVRYIGLRHLRMPYHAVTPAEGEETITQAAFPLRRAEGAAYVRAVVEDAQGRRAWSNPIFLEENDYEK